MEVLVFAHHPLLERFLLRRGRDDLVHFIDQGLLIHRDLETADLNDPRRECIFDLFQDLLSPPFVEREGIVSPERDQKYTHGVVH